MDEDRPRQAIEALNKARENLLTFLVEEVVEREAILTGATNYEGPFSFEFQEIDNKFMGRLASINTFLHNLYTLPGFQQKKPKVPQNAVEVVVSEADDLSGEINKALGKHRSRKLVGTSMHRDDEGRFVVILAFTSP